MDAPPFANASTPLDVPSTDASLPPADFSPQYLAPWEIDPTTQGVHTGSGTANVLALNLLLCLGTLPIWCCVVKRLPIYRTTGAPPEVWLWRVWRTHGFAQWVRDLGHAQPFEQITRWYGTDTALYIAFLKIMTLCSLVLCTSAMIVTPLHLAKASEDDLTEIVITENKTLVFWEDELFNRHTMVAVQEDASILYVHAFGVVLQTMATLYLMNMFRYLARKIFGANNPLETSLARRTIKIAKFPPHGVGEDQLREFYDALYSGEVEAAYIAYDVRSRIDMNDRLRRVQLRLKCELSKPAEEQKDSTMARLERRKERVLGEIEAWHEHKPTVSAGFAHVVFRSAQTKHLALRKKHVILPMTNTRVEHKSAHHPRDVHWEDVGKVGSKLRRVFINLGLIAGLFFWSTPTAIFTTLQQATERVPVVQDIFGGLGPSEDNTVQKSKFQELLSEYLPVVSYLVLALSLPIIIEWVSGKEPVHSRFNKRKIVMQRLYVYQMLCTFILPSIALSTIMAVVVAFQKEQDDPNRVVKKSMKHLFLPNSGAFFFNVLSVYATLGNWWELWRPVELCKYLNSVVRRKIDTSDGWGTWVLEFEFHWHYPLVMVAWAVAFNYSVFIPLVAPAFAMMCIFKLRIHAATTRSNMIFRRNALDAAQYGKMVKTLVGMWLLSMIICLGFNVGFFVFRSDRRSFYPHISILGFLWLYVIYNFFTVLRTRKSEFVHDLPPLAGESFVLPTKRTENEVSESQLLVDAQQVESDDDSSSSSDSDSDVDDPRARHLQSDDNATDLMLFTQPSAVYTRLEPLACRRERPNGKAPKRPKERGSVSPPRQRNDRPRDEDAKRAPSPTPRSPTGSTSHSSSRHMNRVPSASSVTPATRSGPYQVTINTRLLTGSPRAAGESTPALENVEKIDHTLYAAPFMHVQYQAQERTPSNSPRYGLRGERGSMSGSDGSRRARPAAPHRPHLPGQFIDGDVYVPLNNSFEMGMSMRSRPTTGEEVPEVSMRDVAEESSSTQQRGSDMLSDTPVT